MDDDLGKAVVVAKVDEKDSAMVAKTEHPAGEFHGLSGVGGAKFITGMRTVRMHFGLLKSLIGEILHIIPYLGRVQCRQNAEEAHYTQCVDFGIIHEQISRRKTP
jgi:hypothetical protein